MQFIPSTWSVVGVDADGDGVRNPQDVDDAALGTAVYLCSGADDLGTDDGRRSAVFRYNHSQSYVDLVLAIMDAYLQGDFTSIPNGTVMAGELTKAPPPLHVPGAPADATSARSGRRTTTTTTRRRRAGRHRPTDAADDTGGGTTGGGNGNGGGNNNGGGGGVNVPGTHVTIPPLPTTSIPPVDQVLTLAQATAQCALDGLDQLLQPAAFQQCLDDYMNPQHRGAQAVGRGRQGPPGEAAHLLTRRRAVVTAPGDDGSSHSRTMMST